MMPERRTSALLSINALPVPKRNEFMKCHGCPTDRTQDVQTINLCSKGSK
jgi:hypothetical protein